MSHSVRKADEPRYYPLLINGTPQPDGWAICNRCFGYSCIDDFKHESGCRWSEIDTVHLAKVQQRVMDRALRRSVKVLP